jgi:hypothetical protein
MAQHRGAVEHIAALEERGNAPRTAIPKSFFL